VLATTIKEHYNYKNTTNIYRATNPHTYNGTRNAGRIESFGSIIIDPFQNYVIFIATTFPYYIEM